MLRTLQETLQEEISRAELTTSIRALRQQTTTDHVRDDPDHQRPQDRPAHDGGLERRRRAVRDDLGETTTDHQGGESHDEAEKGNLARQIAEET